MWNLMWNLICTLSIKYSQEIELSSKKITKVDNACTLWKYVCTWKGIRNALNLLKNAVPWLNKAKNQLFCSIISFISSSLTWILSASLPYDPVYLGVGLRFFTRWVLLHRIYESVNLQKIRPLHHLATFYPLLAFLLLLCFIKKVQSLLKKVLIEVLISCKWLLVMTSQ